LPADGVVMLMTTKKLRATPWPKPTASLSAMYADPEIPEPLNFCHPQ